MEKLNEYLENKNYKALQEEIKNFHVADLAEFLNDLERQQAVIFFRLLNKDIAADVFANLSGDQKRAIVETIKFEEIQGVINDLHLDDKVDLLEELPANAVKNILKYTEAKERELINQFLNYKEDSAGSIMTIEYVALKGDMTVEEALMYIRKNGVDKETIYSCYVLGPNKKLKGVLSLREIVTAERNVLISDLMVEDVIYVHTDTDQEEVAEIFGKYDFLTLPVVDTEGRMTGIVTVDEVMEVMELETTEDFHTMAGMTPSEGGYLEESPIKLAKDRIIWLSVLLILGIFIGGIIEKYNWILAQYLILNSFIPMITAAGGNAGIQSSTLAIRNISLEEINFDDKFKIMYKELKVGLIVGGIMGIISFMKVIFLDQVSLSIGLVVMVTMLISIVIAKVLGGLIPLLADRMNIDPAIMSSSIITTLVDAVSLIIYFTVAALLLPI